MLKVEITPIYKDYINALTNRQIANLSKKICRTRKGIKEGRK